jgi:hypothetical protein
MLLRDPELGDRGLHLTFTLETTYSETSIHRFRQGFEKETMDPGKQ